MTRLVVGPPGDRRAGWCRSYLADGRLVQWRPPHPGRWAIDAERADQPVPPALARRFGTADPARFWPLWTVAEVWSKLLDVPVVQRLGAPGPADVTLWTVAWNGLIVTRGRRAS